MSELCAVIQEERRRIRAILEAPEAAGQEPMALELATSTDMSAQEAVQVLGLSARTLTAAQSPLIQFIQEQTHARENAE